MPQAFSASGGKKYWLQDHDAAILFETPPVQNTWYELLEDTDVQLQALVVSQANDEEAFKELEVRLTTEEGAVTLVIAADHNTAYFIFENFAPMVACNLTSTDNQSLAGELGLMPRQMQYCKIEVRLTDPAGTDQTLQCSAVYETLEET